MKLKQLKDQTIVITGATSGIGLATARMAAKQGARVVLAGRSGDALEQVREEIEKAGGKACAVVADVARQEDVRRIADEAVRQFGGFDTWVNNAGVSIYGNTFDIPIEDQRKLFDTNYWGVVAGSVVASEHLRRKGTCGAIINVGSVVSDRALPLQGVYSASKAAVKAFTDALRMELQHQKSPVAVTLIQPASIGTPFAQHAKNYMDAQPRLPSPLYAPESVAKAILHAAQKPVRNLMVGAASRMFSSLAHYSPRLTDRYMEAKMFREQKEQVAAGGRKSILDEPSEDPRERGYLGGRQVVENDVYSTAARNPVKTAALAVGAGIAVAALVRRKGRAPVH